LAKPQMTPWNSRSRCNQFPKLCPDGYDQSDLLLNQGRSKRKEFYYFTEATLHGMRYGDWKVLFRDQEGIVRQTCAGLRSVLV